jgi:hypothetical protein
MAKGKNDDKDKKPAGGKDDVNAAGGDSSDKAEAKGDNKGESKDDPKDAQKDGAKDDAKDAKDAKADAKDDAKDAKADAQTDKKPEPEPEPEPTAASARPAPAPSPSNDEPERWRMLPPQAIDTDVAPTTPAPAPGKAPRGDARSMRRDDEFCMIYRHKSHLIRRQGKVGTAGEWTVTEYPNMGAAAHAYAQECSELSEEGFVDVR